MTLREKFIATAYTGIVFFNEEKHMGEFYKFLEEELEIKCVDVTLASSHIQRMMKVKSESLFGELCMKEND